MTVPNDQTALLEAARAWAAEDPDEQTRAELEALRPTSPTASPAPSSSAPPACAAPSAPAPTG